MSVCLLRLGKPWQSLQNQDPWEKIQVLRPSFASRCSFLSLSMRVPRLVYPLLVPVLLLHKEVSRTYVCEEEERRTLDEESFLFLSIFSFFSPSTLFTVRFSLSAFSISSISFRVLKGDAAFSFFLLETSCFDRIPPSFFCQVDETLAPNT